MGGNWGFLLSFWLLYPGRWVVVKVLRSESRRTRKGGPRERSLAEYRLIGLIPKATINNWNDGLRIVGIISAHVWRTDTLDSHNGRPFGGSCIVIWAYFSGGKR